MRPVGEEPAAGPEAVPVHAVRAQPADVDVNAVAVLRTCLGGAAAHLLAEAGVLGDLPADLHHTVGHAAAVQRVGSEPGPQHDGVRQRVAGGDAEAEHAVGQRGYG